MTIQRAESEDLRAVHEMLAAENLPAEGISVAADVVLVAKRGDNVIGASAVEKYGLQGLLRSVVVAPELRSTGVGRLLVEEALREAAAEGVYEIWLLTLDAEDFFVRFGFESVKREAVTGPIRESAEFSRLCPDSAVSMRLKLGQKVDL